MINWICQLLRRNCLIKHIIKGKIERTGRQEGGISSCWMNFRKKRNISLLKTEIGSSELQCLENSLWKRLWNCLKKDYVFFAGDDEDDNDVDGCGITLPLNYRRGITRYMFNDNLLLRAITNSVAYSSRELIVAKVVKKLAVFRILTVCLHDQVYINLATASCVLSVSS